MTQETRTSRGVQAGSSSVVDEFCDLFRLEPFCVRLNKNASSITVPSMERFYGKVIFEEWKNFKSQVKNAMAMIQTIMSHEDLREAILFASAAQNELHPTPIRQELLSLIPDVYYAGSYRKEESSAVPAPPTFTRYVENNEPVFSNEASLLGVFANVFSSVGSLVRNMCGSNRISFRMRSMYSDEVMSAGTDLRSRARGGQSSDSPSKEEQHTLPNRNLVTLSNLDDVSGTPICCFKLNGPEECITGREFEPTDCIASPPAGSASNEIASDIVKLPSRLVADDSKKMAARFGVLFQTASQSTMVKAVSAASEPVSQALQCALYSESGYSYICNIASGVAIKLERGRELDKFVAKVALIEDFQGESVGQIAALTYVSLEACSRMKLDKNLSRHMKEMRGILQPSTGDSRNDHRNDDVTGPSGKRRRKDDGDQDLPTAKRSKENAQEAMPKPAGSHNGDDVAINNINYLRLRVTDPGVDQNPIAADSNIERKDEGTGPSERRVREDDRDMDLRTAKRSRENEQKIVQEPMKSQKNDVSNSETDCNATALVLQDLQPANSAEITEVMRHATVPLGCERSESVHESRWREKRVVLKTWNDNSKTKRYGLCHEIEMYRFIKEEYAEILGRAVPKLILFWNVNTLLDCPSPRIGVVLEYVGERIYSVQRRLFIGSNSESIDEKSKKEIKRAALRSLGMLHEMNILHGDIRLSHMRVLKTLPGTKPPWHVWWVSLTEARGVNPEEKFEIEAERDLCKNLFR